jgi:flagellar biogenesis protein FliO
LELIDQLAVGARCSVQLIRVNDQFIVIGRDAQGLKAMVPIWPSFGAWSANLEDQQEHGTVEHELAVTHE